MNGFRLTHVICPGVYGDSKGQLHLDIQAQIAHRGFPNTPVTRKWLACRALTELRREIDTPRLVLIAHLGRVTDLTKGSR